MIKKTDIDFDPRIEKFRIRLALDLMDGNPLMLKARADLYLAIMDGIGPIVDATIAEFAERYGEEVIKYAHNNVEKDKPSYPTATKFVSNREIQKNLLKQLPED